MRKKLRAFISGGNAIDLSLARRALTELGVESSDAFDFDPGQRWADSLMKRIREADFAIVLAESAGPNTWVELGMCQGLGKPVLVVADADTPLPAMLIDEVQLRTRSVDTDLFRRTVGALVKDIGKRRESTKPAKPKGRVPQVDRDVIANVIAQLTSKRPRATGYEVLELTGRLLSAAGVAPVENEPIGAARGADFAIWSDELRAVVGNPILVEVKAGVLNPARIAEAQRQVLEQIARAQVGAGLLLYLDRRGRRFLPPAPNVLVLVFDLEDFPRALLGTPFSQLVLRTRNTMVHGTAS